MKLTYFFEQNPLLLKFCRQSGIYEQIVTIFEHLQNGVLDKQTALKQVTTLIEKTPFPENFQERFDQPKPLIIGNGDVQTLAEAREKATKYDVDGVMFGRAIFNNPFLFNPQVQTDSAGNLFFASRQIVDKKMRIQLLLQHLNLWEQTWQNQKSYAILKKYFKIYIANFEGSSQLRAKLMETQNLPQARSLLLQLLDN